MLEYPLNFAYSFNLVKIDSASWNSLEGMAVAGRRNLTSCHKRSGIPYVVELESGDV